MKFVISRDKLLEPLQLACGVVERRQTSPILGNVLLVADDDTLVLTGSDQEIELTVTLRDISVIEAGEVTVPARKLLDICKSLPDGAELSAELQENRVAVDSGRFSSHLATLPAAEFPSISIDNPDVVIDIATTDLTRLLQRTSFAMAQQDVRYFFNGILLEIDDDAVRFVATNGQRLATSLVDMQIASDNAQFIVPRKTVAELPRIVAGADDETVSLRLNNHHLAIDHGPVKLISKLIDATYPDYSRAIPKGGDKVVLADRNELKEALTRTAILSNELYRNVRLILQSGRIDMHANNPQQEEAEETVSVDYAGDELEIGFNVSYLIEALGALQGEKVRITFSDPSSACLLEDPDEPETLLVISPMVL